MGESADLTVETLWPDRDRGCVQLVLNGFVDSSTAMVLDQALTAASGDGAKAAVVDLKNTEYVSSIGWGMFVVHNRILTERGGGLVLAGMRSELEFVYKSMGFAALVKSFASIEDALKAFAAKSG